MSTPQARRLIEFFESLQPHSLEALDDHYSDYARFVDPFNDVCGVAAIREVFEHMFATCEAPRFDVDECLGGDVAYLRWRFSFGPGGARSIVDGVSRIVFDCDGRVIEHRDFWDPARQLYEHIPLVGRVFRALRWRLGATVRERPSAHSTQATRYPT